jgi:hypothetical protein
MPPKRPRDSVQQAAAGYLNAIDCPRPAVLIRTVLLRALESHMPEDLADLVSRCLVGLFGADWHPNPPEHMQVKLAGCCSLCGEFSTPDRPVVRVAVFAEDAGSTMTPEHATSEIAHDDCWDEHFHASIDVCARCADEASKCLDAYAMLGRFARSQLPFARL